MVWGRTGIRETAVARVPDFSIAGNDTDTPRRHLEQRGRLLRQLRRSKFQTCSVLPNVHAHRRATAMKKKAPTLHARPASDNQGFVRRYMHGPACRDMSARWRGWTSLKHPLVVERTPDFYGNSVPNWGPEAHSLRRLHCSLIEPTIATGTLNNNVFCPSLVRHQNLQSHHPLLAIMH